MKITTVEMPKNKYSIKCPYSMTPIGITVHETYNDAPAKNEISYMQSNNNQVSFHYAVDDLGAIQGAPLNRNTWHAGDGAKGTGNRKTIAIECCYSKSGGDKYAKAFDNTLTLVAQILKEKKWSVDKVYYHNTWSGKNCPNRALANGIDLAKYRKLVQARYDELFATVDVGSKVKINAGAVYGGSARGKAIPLWVRLRTHTVSKIQVNNGIKEALLKEINSWVAVSSLKRV